MCFVTEKKLCDHRLQLEVLLKTRYTAHILLLLRLYPQKTVFKKKAVRKTPIR